MSLDNLWQQRLEAIETEEENQSFFKAYYAREQSVYEQLLSNHSQVESGKVTDLCEKYDMELELFAGFLEGINSSLKKELELSELSEDSEIALDIDYEKLYFNMMDAKASWLYNLEQWEDILSDERRKEIQKEWRTSKMAVSEKVDRNAPCPCGSGKKYKKCCGAV